MKIGILSDIHGNVYALERVLATARKENVQKLCILGDIVGYYYHPDKILDALSEWDTIMIKGNHEKLLEKLISGQENAEALKRKYGSGHNKAVEKLSEDALHFLFSLPDSAKFTIDDISIGLYHGSVSDPDRYLYPDSEINLLNNCSDGSDFIFIGHSHYPFIYKSESHCLVNVGSVGQSRSNGGIASWCILNTQNKALEMKATPYDITALVVEIQNTDPDNPYLSNILKRNRI